MTKLLGIGGSCVVIKNNDNAIKIMPDIDRYVLNLNNSMNIKKYLTQDRKIDISDNLIFPIKFKKIDRLLEIDRIFFKYNKDVRGMDFENYFIIDLPLFKETSDCFDFFLIHKKTLYNIDLLCVLNQFWQGLYLLHDNEIIHNDIKLENLLISYENEWKIRILDFDFSFKFDEADDKKGVGTFNLIFQTSNFSQKVYKIYGVFQKFFHCFKRKYNEFLLTTKILQIQHRLEILYLDDKINFFKYNDIFNGIVLSLFMIKVNQKNDYRDVYIDDKFVKEFLELINIDENFKFKEINEIMNYLKKMII